MKRLIVGLLALACAGCVPAAKVNLPDAAKSEALPVSDMRPASEKEKKIFSLLITSKEYGVIRISDTQLQPSPVNVLQYEAFQKLGPAHKVTVYHFVTYINAKAQLRSQAVFAGIGGLVGGMIANSVAEHTSSPETRLINQSTFENVSGDDEYERAYYTSSESPNNGPVYITYLDTDIDGKRLFTRTVAPMRVQGNENALAAAIELAVKDHLSDYDRSAIATPAAFQSAQGTTLDLSTHNAAASNATSSVSSTASASPQASMGEFGMASKAQDVANQLGCGAVQSNGNSSYVAPCGDHGIYIDCDGDACRPLHTVRLKGDE
jgi:hypothetical protein